MTGVGTEPEDLDWIFGYKNSGSGAFAIAPPLPPFQVVSKTVPQGR